MNIKGILILVLGATCLLSVAGANGYAQESVAEAARKAQASKKTAPKAKMVIDNDSLDTIKGTISIVGQVPPPADAAKAPAAATDDKAKGAAVDKKAPVHNEAFWRSTFATANKKLADDAHELDILQREYNLKQQQYYSDPNTAMKEQFDRHDLTDTKTKIDEKTTAVAQDKQDISNLEDSLRQEGGDPGWARPQL